VWSRGPLMRRCEEASGIEGRCGAVASPTPCRPGSTRESSWRGGGARASWGGLGVWVALSRAGG
jgi:hypothetical protein